MLYKMKRLYQLIAFILLSSIPATLFAVTDKEMDQARALATLAYLRYANDGSGYLDDIRPKSMAELEKSLKAKEQENIKAFKAIPVPKDFASWDKQKLVEYWGITAFSSNGLIEKGRLGRNRAKKYIGNMTIADPAKQQPQEPEKPKETAAPQQPAEKAAAEAPAEKAAEASQPSASPEAADAAANASAMAEAELAEEALMDADADPQLQKASNHTWIYIVILCILVGVVVALVVFASNVMKKNNAAAENGQPSSPSGNDNVNDMRDKFAATLASKNDEIRALSKKLENALNQNASLKSNLEGLTAESASLRTRLAEANKRVAEFSNALAAVEQQKSAPSRINPAESAATDRVTPAETAPAATQPQEKRNVQAPEKRNVQHQEKNVQSPVRSIYLGRANAKGIFIRADRSLNLGNSVFRLDTSDGFAGSFRVVNDPTVWEMAFLTPRESLSNACVAPEIDNTEGMTKIINDSAGTAIFEGGCWKVIRKAKIHYE